MFKYSIAILSLILTTCSEKPSDAGLCSLSCGSAVIGAVDANLELMGQATGVTCDASQAGLPLSNPLTFYFRVSETINVNGVESILPKPTVSIEPIVNGSMSGEVADNPNVTIDGTVYTPARYKGIITPKENWCSDACGVVTMEVVAVCPPAGEASEVNVQVHSGASFSETAAVTIQTQDSL